MDKNGWYFLCGTDCGTWFCGCVGVDGDIILIL